MYLKILLYKNESIATSPKSKTTQKMQHSEVQEYTLKYKQGYKSTAILVAWSTQNTVNKKSVCDV